MAGCTNVWWIHGIVWRRPSIRVLLLEFLLKYLEHQFLDTLNIFKQNPTVCMLQEVMFVYVLNSWLHYRLFCLLFCFNFFYKRLKFMTHAFVYSDYLSHMMCKLWCWYAYEYHYKLFYLSRVCKHIKKIVFD